MGTTLFYWTVYYLTRWLYAAAIPHKIVGMEHLPPKGAFILACNHLSNLDPTFIGSHINRRLSFLAKDALFHNRFLRFSLRRLGVIPIRRESSDFRALREAIRRLKEGTPLIMFPEGSREAVRRAANHGEKIYSGIGFLAAKSGVPVIPAKISGSDKVLPVHAKRPRRHPIRLVIGQPRVFSEKEFYPQIAYHIMDAIASL